MATPQTLGILMASEGVTEAEVMEAYAQLRGTAGKAERQFEEGRQASSEVSGDVEPCPPEDGSEQSDAKGDVLYNDSIRADKTKRPPAGADLIEVQHNADGDDLCFALTFADDAPSKGAADIRLRPDDRLLSVSWGTNGRVLGQRRDPRTDKVAAVPTQVARDSEQIVIRFPSASLDQRAGGYRWAVQSFVQTPDGTNAYVDSVPQDLSVTADGEDGYVRQR